MMKKESDKTRKPPMRFFIKVGLLLLVSTNILLVTLIVLNWKTSQVVKKSFSDSTQEIGKDLKGISNSADNLDKELGNIRSQLAGLVSGLEQASNELAKIEQGLKETKLEGVKKSIDELATTIEQEIACLTEKGTDIHELGEEIKNDLTDLVGKLEDLKQIFKKFEKFEKFFCSNCERLNFPKVSGYINVDDITIEEGKWKKLVQNKQINLEGEIELYEICEDVWEERRHSWFLMSSTVEKREKKIKLVETKKINTKDITKKEVKVCEDSDDDTKKKKEREKEEKEVGYKWKEIKLFNKVNCDKCGKKMILENFKNYENKVEKILELVANA